nr:substrate-binding domain-containing protein [Bifidobacterium choloepi]
MDRAVRLLRALGHDRIAFVCDRTEEDMVYNATERRQAFLQSAETCGYSTDDATIITANDVNPRPIAELAAHLAVQLLASPVRPTAVCVETDLLAIALIKELSRQHIRVPEDLSVIGFDDAAIADAAELTTIRQDPVQLGRDAATMVLSLLQGHTLEKPHILMEPIVVLRNTTARYGHGDQD